MHSFRRLAPFLFALVFALVASPAFAQVAISIDVAPPPLIVEDQPPAPDDGYLWTPGYWAYDPDQGSYYWVDGTWVQPPEVGLYWTPNYWGWENGAYAYHEGYWGPNVGFYGGVNYGYGYYGNGYGGGRWDNGHFFYNSAANNIRGGNFRNVYVDRTVIRTQNNRVSFNGGKGGIQAQPSAKDELAAHERHVQATSMQQSHFQSATQTRSHAVKINAKKAGGENATQHSDSNGAEGMKETGAPKEPMHEKKVSHDSSTGSEAKPMHEKKHAMTESHSASMGEPKHEHVTHPSGGAPKEEHHAAAAKPEAKAAGKAEGKDKKDH